MTLAKLDFSDVKSGFDAVPAGDYPGQTVRGWEAKPTKAGDSTNVEVKFLIEHEGKKQTVLHRWNLKPAALWRIKRDLIALGADPRDFESKSVDLEKVLNSLFSRSAPIAVILTMAVRPYTRTVTQNGETTEVTTEQNDIERIVLA